MIRYLFYIVFLCLIACQTHVNHSAQKTALINVQLGLGYLQEKQFTRAKQKLLLALQQAPNLVETQLAMGYFYLTVGEKKQSSIYYHRALQLAPQSGQVQNNMGVFYCRTKRYHKAIHYFKLAAHNMDYLHTAAAYENAGLCALNIPDQQLAKIFFKQALRYDSHRPVSLFELKKLPL